MTPKSLLQPLLAFCLLSASACTSSPFLNQSVQTSSLQVSQGNGLSAYQAKQRALWQQFKNKPTYSGPLKMAIQTNLLNPGQGGRQVDLTNQLDSQDFQIQSVPQGPLVFQETFTKGKGDYEVIRGFQLTNTSQRYTLHIEAEGKKLEGQISVNINGTDWIKPGDFKGQEAESNSLLLNANNSMRVRIQGKEGTSYTVSLIEGGEAGTVLRRRGNLRKEDENQARHIRQNDINIFNPNDPNSLGGLTPYQGHLEGEDVPPVVTGVAVDSGLPLQFEAGTLILRLREPEVILPILQSKYGATVLDKLETPGYPEFTYYYLQFDLSKSPVSQVAQLIRTYRTKIPADFNEFVFASLSSLQTFTILMDLMVNYEPYIATWEFNTYKKPPMENLMPIKPVPNDLNQQNQNPVVSNNKGWWLRDTYVNEAWNLSLGTGVNVAYIDHGFKGIFNGTTPESEFGHRLLFKPPSLLDGFGRQNLVAERRKSEVNILSTNQLECADKPGLNYNGVPYQTNYCGGDHGTTTAMAGFAQRDNGRGTVGVAPNANLVPYNADGFMYTYAQALVNIVLSTGKIDVIGYNKQDQAPKSWTPIYTVPNDPGNDPYSKTMLKTFIAILNTGFKIPFVVAAGNDGSSCPSVETGSPVKTIKKDCSYEFIPSSFDGQPSPLDPTKTISLIIAGGAERKNVAPVSSPIPLGAHNANSNKDIIGWGGSAIGNNYVWVPANQIEVLDFSFSGGPLINHKQGTSFSCPILTGVVALMKSRNPDLTPQEIKTILRNSPTKIDITHDSGVPSPLRLTNEPFIDAQYAVEEAIKKKAGSQPAHYVAKDYFALISDTAGKKTARLNRSILASAKPDDKEKTLLRSVADNVWNGALASGKLVKMKGWSNITAGSVSNMAQNLEVLQAEDICPANACTNPGAFKPQLNEVIYPANPAASNGFELELKGQNLVADMRPGITSSPIKLIFKAKASLATPPQPLPSPDPIVDLSSSDILDISNDGSYVKVKIPANKIPANFDYQLIFRSGITGVSNLCSKYTQGSSSTSAFSVKATGGSSNTFTLQSVTSSPPSNGPSGVNVWLTQNGKHQPVNPSQLVGIGITGLDLNGITVEIDGQPMSIRKIAQEYITVGIPANISPGLKDVIIKLAGSSVTLAEAIEVLALPRLNEVQSIPTIGSTRFASLNIGGETFLAAPNSYDQPPPNYNLSVEIYKWTGNQFSTFQSIPANGPYAVEAFSIGNDHFLALAEYYNTPNLTFDFNSRIFKWDGTRFVLFQEIPTHGANGWKHFEMDSQHYLIVANHATASNGNALNVNVDSVIYKWNGAQFIPIQSLPSTAARDWEYVEIGNARFLAVANEYNGISYSSSTQIYSEIFKWDGTQFRSFQKVHSEGARDWKAFSIDNHTFLALGNLWGSTGSPATAEKPKIYEWKGSQFEEVQSFDTAVLSWDHLSQNGQEYLISAGSDSGGVRMYHWNGNQWDLLQTIPMPGAYDASFFNIAGTNFAAVSIYYANNSYHNASKIYRLE